MSAAERIKNNELKLQQEKVWKDVRKNFLEKKKKGKKALNCLYHCRVLRGAWRNLLRVAKVRKLAAELSDGLSRLTTMCHQGKLSIKECLLATGPNNQPRLRGSLVLKLSCAWCWAAKLVWQDHASSEHGRHETFLPSP